MVMSEFRMYLPQVVAVSIKNIILVSFGMTLGFPTVLIPALQENNVLEKREEFSLNKNQISWISSINLICVPLGCIFSGSFTSLIGRRRAMQFVCLPLFAAWIIFFYSNQVYHLYIALCLSGFSGGMNEAPVLTYVAEISTPKLRGLLAATGSFCIILGIFSQFLMGLYLDWRTISLISSFVPVVAIVLLCFVPESPYWLILKKRDEEAKKSLMWLRGWQKDFNGVKTEFNELRANLNMVHNCEKDISEGNFIKPFTRRSFLLPYFICSLAFFVGHFSGMTTLQTYAVSIFAQLNAPIDMYFATMLLGICELIGTAICVILVQFAGKRLLTIVSTLGCSICFFATAAYAFFNDRVREDISNTTIIPNISSAIDNFINSSSSQITETILTASEVITRGYTNNIQTSDNNDNTPPPHEIVNDNEMNPFSWVPLTLLLASALLSHSGIRLLPWMLIGEVYPTRIRGIATGLTGGTSYIFGFLANKLFLNMVGTLTLPGTFLLYSCVGTGGCIILFLLLPETECRTLKEIEDHFSGKQKLPRTFKQKGPIVTESFPKNFDVSHWESNERFEKSLRDHQINYDYLKGQDLHWIPHHDFMGMKRYNLEKPRGVETSLEGGTLDTHL